MISARNLTWLLLINFSVIFLLATTTDCQQLATSARSERGAGRSGPGTGAESQAAPSSPLSRTDRALQEKKQVNGASKSHDGRTRESKSSKSAHESAAQPLGSSNAEALVMAPKVSATAQAEVGEGLTLDGHGTSEPASNGNQPWPLKESQFERIKSESRVSALIGQNVILNCPVQFKDGVEKPFVVNWLKYPNKLPIYIWYAGYPPHLAQGYENRVSRLGQASLNLSQVKEADKGLYECKIYYLDRKGDEAQDNRTANDGTWLYLDVQAPPRFVQTPPTVSYVQAGDSIHLACQAESTPSPIIRWYKNKSPIDADNGSYRLVVASDSNANKSRAASGGSSSSQLDLYIDNIQAGLNTGDYSCLASNSEGSIEAHSQVVLAIPAVIVTMPKNLTAMEGNKAEFQCQAKALPSNITYKWFFNDKPISQLKWFENRFQVKRDGTLVIPALHRDDQGEYKCQATNGLTHNFGHKSKPTDGPSSSNRVIYAEASASLQVEFPARITYSPPVQYLPLGLSGLIKCFHESIPPLQFITWTLNNQQYDPNSDPNIERQANGSLLVKQVSRDYEGQYRCTPFNSYGSAGSSGPMDVHVAEPPYFELRPADFYRASVNGQIKIPCDGSGSPKPAVNWRKVIASSSSGGGQTQARQSQRQARAQAAAWQDAGQQQHHHAPPMMMTMNNNDELADEADDHHLYATAANIIPSTVKSLELANDEYVQHSNPINATDDSQQSVIPQTVITYAKLPSDRAEFKGSNLILNNLRKEDHGRYECVIENEVATLVASTMLYIEETTPHAPTNLHVETKTWSAQVNWLPGYDGGFEQSFVIWYRQDPDNKPHSGNAAPPQGQELLDFNWKSLNVPSGEQAASTSLQSFGVHNLSQDTGYEFYVRAKNIIGDGPRSEIVQARTKRAISGSFTPINPTNALMPEVLAITQASGEHGQQAGSELAVTQLPSTADDEESEPHQHQQMTVNPAVMGIIHLVDVSSARPTSANSSPNQSSALQSVQQQQQQHGETSEQSNESSNGNNSSKVIRIYFPSKTNSSSASQAEPANSKRPRFDFVENNATLSNNTTHSADQADQQASNSTQAVDLSGAPQNVSIIKVAQGWVLTWFPPLKIAQAQASALERMEQPQLTQGDASVSVNGAASRQSTTDLANQPSAYLVEFREKAMTSWSVLATSKERSLLLKDLKPGGEYSFRIYALTSSPPSSSQQLRSVPSLEFKYLIPDNRRKPGSTQALSAGVVSGILFFIACIVIAVCAVNMCNKRRKKRAEKAAYVMMACPVLESHHDIAALNSNSLMKNANSAKDRVSSLKENKDDDDDGAGQNYSRNLQLSTSGSQHKTGKHQESDNSNSYERFNVLEQLSSIASTAKLRLQRALLKGGPEVAPNDQDSRGSAAAASASDEQQLGQSHIEYSENASVPVDVSPEFERSQFSNDQVDSIRVIDDDYWIRTPSNRKWGTLTVAAGKLAERRARKAAESASSHAAVVDEFNNLEKFSVHYGQTERSSYADIIINSGSCSSKTLPRSFKSLPDARTSSFGKPQKPAQQQQRTMPADTNVEQFGAGKIGPVSERVPPRVPPRRSELLLAQQQQIKRQSAMAHQHQRSISQTEPAALMRHYGQPPQQYWHWLGAQNQVPTLNQLASFQQATTDHYLEQEQPNRNQIILHNQITTDPFAGHQLMPISSLFDQQTFEGYNNCAIGKRNSFARSTMPFLSAAHYYPPVNNSMGPLTQTFNNSNGFMQPPMNRGVPPCPFYPTINMVPRHNPVAEGSARGQVNAAQQRLCDDVDDDPITDNACLGSYKRKRRLPHIEAKFTITPPELPPKNLNNSATHESSPSKSNEQRALESGRLFVRPKAIAPLPTVKRPTKKPPGLPQPGQRREQRRLKPPFASLVDTIGPAEKIETYLKHYESLQQLPIEPEADGPRVMTDGSGTSSSSSLSSLHEGRRKKIELDHASELSFQPYYNLPGLKYTINLPVRKTDEGKLILEETNGIKIVCKRHQKHKRRHHSVANELIATMEKPQNQAKQRLGSSSSCPASRDYRRTSRTDQVLKQVNSSRMSLESALNQPTLGHTIQLPVAADSLEESLNIPDGKPIRAAPPPLPPPIPAHRSLTMKDCPSNETRMVVARHQSNSSSVTRRISPPSSNLSSSSAGSPSDSNERGESLNNDHSVDENYEFDLISSCSSSTKLKVLRRKQTGEQQPSTEQTASAEVIYSRVDKGALAPGRETSRFYDYSSRCKEQPLNTETQPTNIDKLITNNPSEQQKSPAGHYDTVCEDPASNVSVAKE